jgi:hypothetical protein
MLVRSGDWCLARTLPGGRKQQARAELVLCRAARDQQGRGGDQSNGEALHARVLGR